MSSAQSQTCYDEARRIGEGYAGIILRALDDAELVPPAPLAFSQETFTLHKRAVPPADNRRR